MHLFISFTKTKMYSFFREIFLQYIFSHPRKSTKIKENEFLISVN